MSSNWIQVGLCALAVWGCSESKDPDPATATTSGGGGAGQGGSGASSTGGTGNTGVGGTSPDADVVINEINGRDNDWIELYNRSSGEVDLGGFQVADENDDGTPNLAEALVFPEDTLLGAGEYLLIVLDQDDMPPGPHTTCLPDGGPAECYYAPWKVSASEGEVIRLFAADDAALDAVEFPADPAVPAGATWGRLPDGSDNLAATAPTPGASNAAP